jgi:hypothetical protein
MINFYRKKGLKRMTVLPAFSITLHKKDIDLLHKIKAFFGNIGLVTQWSRFAIFKVQSIEEISGNIISRGLPASSRFSGGRSHFDKYPLITRSFGLPSAAAGGDRGQKKADYLLFRPAGAARRLRGRAEALEIIIMMLRKEHLNKQGLQSIINIKASLNLGLSEDLKLTFPETKPVARPIVSDQKIPDPE